jgi:hypothetical protein
VKGARVRVTEDRWRQAQEAESEWWGRCLNTVEEDQRQLGYAVNMGLRVVSSQVRLQPGLRVVDLGGGPSSLLLKAVGYEEGGCAVIDPLPVPQWVWDRYTEAGVALVRGPVEWLPAPSYRSGAGRPPPYREAWFYDVLNSVIDPREFCRIARQIAGRVRFFEFLDMPVSTRRPHRITEEQIRGWLDLKRSFADEVFVSNSEWPGLSNGRAIFGVVDYTAA